jgi:hypothetical protein
VQNDRKEEACLDDFFCEVEEGLLEGIDSERWKDRIGCWRSDLEVLKFFIAEQRVLDQGYICKLL